MIYQAKKISKETKSILIKEIMQPKEVLLQILKETRKQWVETSNKLPFVPYV